MRGLAAALATVIIGGLLLYASVVGAILFLLVGALYALLLWRGMPLLADFHTTKHYLLGLNRAGTASPPMTFPPGQYPPHMQAGPHFRPPQASYHSTQPAQPVQPAPMPVPEPETTLLPTGRPAYTEAIAQDPATPAAVLNAIAGSRPDLHAALARNPATYADLLTWLSELKNPAVDAELAKRPSSR